MSRTRKRRRVVGDVVAIPLGQSERVGFGLVLKEPLMAFFDVSADSGAKLSAEAIICYPVAFTIWVASQPIVDGLWPVLGKVTVPEKFAAAPWFLKQDPISGRITVGRAGTEERPPAQDQVNTLERAAVWSAGHVVDRLRDHFAGRPNKWVASMRPRSSTS
jgi:Immunity protein 26